MSLKNFGLSVKCLSFKRIINYTFLFYDFGCSLLTKKLRHFHHLPVFISVEPANFCNLHCPECPVGIANNRPTERQELDLQLLQKLITELSSTLHTILFYFQGEPLLAKEFHKMVALAKEQNIYTISSTNAQNISKSTAKKIVESKLDKLIISIDGYTQESYEQYRIGGKLSKAIQSIEYIDFWKKELNIHTPYIELQCLMLKSNEHEWALLKKHYKNWGANSISFKTAQFYHYEHGNNLMPGNPKYSRYTRTKEDNYIIKNKLRNRCFRLWSGAVVDVQGNIRPCCFDKQNQFSFGNIKGQDFKSIWFGNKANYFRQQVIIHRKDIEICRNCI